MGLFHKQKADSNLVAMCQGEVRDISDACDMVFSQKMMGDGIMLIPEESIISAPCKAEVLMCFPTKHAIGLKLENEIELLLHFGVDTVNLDGEGFDLKVKQGDIVAVGEPLWIADLDYIKAHAPSEAIMIIVTANPKGLALEKHLGKYQRNEKILAFR